jgi:hypothetical protein
VLLDVFLSYESGLSDVGLLPCLLITWITAVPLLSNDRAKTADSEFPSSSLSQKSQRILESPLHEKAKLTSADGLNDSDVHLLSVTEMSFFIWTDHKV